MNKDKVLSAISGASVIELEGNELTEYKGFTIYLNGTGENRMYSVFEKLGGTKDKLFVRLDKDEVKNFVVNKVTLLGYTLGGITY